MFSQLCQGLPLPAEDTAEARDARDLVAMTAVAAFDPATVEEAQLAVLIVQNDAHARDALRLAVVHHHDLSIVLRCRAQAAMLQREMHRARKALFETQAQRPVVPAARVEPAAVAPPEAAAAERSDGLSPDSPRRDPMIAEAEDFAMRHPAVAVRLRQRIDPVAFVLADLEPGTPPADPAMLDTLIHGTSPVLSALDRITREWGIAA
jgi:hypothetical protein